MCTRLLFLCAGYLRSFHKPKQVIQTNWQKFLSLISQCECMHSGINLTNLQHHVCCTVALNCRLANWELQIWIGHFCGNGVLSSYQSWKWVNCAVSTNIQRIVSVTDTLGTKILSWLVNCTNDLCTFSSLLTNNYWGVFNSGCPLKMYTLLQQWSFCRPVYKGNVFFFT